MNFRAATIDEAMAALQVAPVAMSDIDRHSFLTLQFFARLTRQGRALFYGGYYVSNVQVARSEAPKRGICPECKGEGGWHNVGEPVICDACQDTGRLHVECGGCGTAHAFDENCSTCCPPRPTYDVADDAPLTSRFAVIR